MPQIDSSLLNVIKNLLSQKEGWDIVCPECIRPRRLVYKFGSSSLALYLALSKGDRWMDIKLNSCDDIRRLEDYDIFDEVYTCSSEVISLFMCKHKDLQDALLLDDYGSIKIIFKDLWDGFINYLK